MTGIRVVVAEDQLLLREGADPAVERNLLAVLPLEPTASSTAAA
jgi:hypothetical protein